jgi:hypothetical protein
LRLVSIAKSLPPRAFATAWPNVTLSDVAMEFETFSAKPRASSTPARRRRSAVSATVCQRALAAVEVDAHAGAGGEDGDRVAQERQAGIAVGGSEAVHAGERAETGHRRPLSARAAGCSSASRRTG